MQISVLHTSWYHDILIFRYYLVILNGVVHFMRFVPFPSTFMQDEVLQFSNWMYGLNLLPTSKTVHPVQFKRWAIRMNMLRNQSRWCFLKCLFILVCQHCKENEEWPSCDRGVWWRGSAQKVSQWNCRPQTTASWGKCQNSPPHFSHFLSLAYDCKLLEISTNV